LVKGEEGRLKNVSTFILGQTLSLGDRIDEPTEMVDQVFPGQLVSFTTPSYQLLKI
jgi:hypothetical protein